MKLQNDSGKELTIPKGQSVQFQGDVGDGTVSIQSLDPVQKDPDEPCECIGATREPAVYAEGVFCNSCGGYL